MGDCNTSAFMNLNFFLSLNFVFSSYPFLLWFFLLGCTSDTPEQEIRRIFEEFGTVNDCFMPTDRDNGKVRGFCFVTMPAADAEKACSGVNGREVDGRALRVNEAQPRGGSGGGGGGGGRGGGGYNDGGYGGGGSG